MLTKILVFFSSAISIISPPGPHFIAKIRTPTCPDGYILIPGNTSYQTSDFCVMKYDAKCSNPDPKCVTTEGVYNNTLPACTCLKNGYKIVSTKESAPITFIPEDDGTNTSAKSYCQNAGGHLITNNEWMTVARNIEQVQSNWTIKNGVKFISNGHSDSKPNKALPAAVSWNLSNGESIWDFAGNVWQWVDISIERKDEPRTIIPGFGNNRWTWGEFQTVSYSNDFDPQDPKLDSKNGVGRIYHYNSSGDTDTTLYTYIRGGNWRHGADSGIFTIHMQPVPDKRGIDDVGFRCAASPI